MQLLKHFDLNEVFERLVLVGLAFEFNIDFFSDYERVLAELVAEVFEFIFELGHIAFRISVFQLSQLTVVVFLLLLMLKLEVLFLGFDYYRELTFFGFCLFYNFL